ncbi:uncharacterized protein EKO05_0007987 [Ascochyta rabiei]|uniref:Uncharacterized protein n=1 Tax=Didymella rabiei TaxID=5454 RepID=A0A163B859_DIDRA|nr:uncharacterized protein EKO05_0007987 [Ascochyta rabiei]KZM21617.1 hypothetical protein ST47_g7263 [Ascochyta rabiei]UPX17646.1 hypothetical protein EKO05_0007987 [Ascochyta rabiei]
MAILAPYNKAGPFYNDDGICNWRVKGKHQIIEIGDSPLSAFQKAGIRTDLHIPIEPVVINFREGPEHAVLIHHPKAVHKALQAEFDFASGDTTPARPFLNQPRTTRLGSTQANFELNDVIPPECTVLIQHPDTVRKALRAQLDNPSNDIPSAFPLLVRRAAVKRKIVTPPIICLKNWPNGDEAEYVGNPHEWASALKADLQGVC